MQKSEKKLMKNSILLLIGNFTSKILVFLLVPFYTAVLTTDEYGTADILTTTVNLVYPILTMMISTAVLRFGLDKDSNKKQVFSIGLWIELLGFLILTICSIALLHIEQLSDYIIYFLLHYITYAIFTLVLQYIKSQDKVGIYAFAGVFNTIIYISCNLILLLKYDLGVKGYLSSMIIAHGITVIFVIVKEKVWKNIISPKKLEKAYAKKMLKYSIPLMPNQLSWWVSNSSDRYIMMMFRTIHDVGVYTVAYKIPTIISTVSGVLINAMELSAVSEIDSHDKNDFFSKMYCRYIDMMVVVCCCLIMVVKPMAFFLFQKEFFTAWVYVPVLVYATVFNTISAFLGTIFTAAKKTNVIFKTTMMGAITNIVLNFCLIPFWGAQGAAIATAISYIAIYIARLIAVRKILVLKIKHSSQIVKFVLLAIMTLLTCLDNKFSYVAGVIIIILEYKFIKNILFTIVTGIKKKCSKN